MTFPLGETIELQHDANVIRQHRDLDLAAQAAQAERHHSLPLVRHWVSSRIVPRTEAMRRMPVGRM